MSIDLPDFDPTLVAVPGGIGFFFFLVRFMLRVQQVAEQRFEGLLDRYRSDLAELRSQLDAERAASRAEIDELRGQLDEERRNCADQLAELRNQLRKVTP